MGNGFSVVTNYFHPKLTHDNKPTQTVQLVWPETLQPQNSQKSQISPWIYLTTKSQLTTNLVDDIINNWTRNLNIFDITPTEIVSIIIKYVIYNCITLNKHIKIQKDKNEKHYISVKTILIGNYDVGKTSFIIRAIKGSYNPNAYFSLPLYLTKIVKSKYNNWNVQLKLHDTHGQEKYRHLAPHYCKYALLALAFYDTTHKESLLDLSNWIDYIIQHNFPEQNTSNQILKHEGLILLTQLQIIVIGTKSDLKDEKEILSNEAIKFCKNQNNKHDRNVIFGGEISVKNNIGINKLLQLAVDTIVSNFQVFVS